MNFYLPETSLSTACKLRADAVAIWDITLFGRFGSNREYNSGNTATLRSNSAFSRTYFIRKMLYEIKNSGCRENFILSNLI